MQTPAMHNTEQFQVYGEHYHGMQKKSIELAQAQVKSCSQWCQH